MNEFTRVARFSPPTALLALLLTGCDGGGASGGIPPDDGENASIDTILPDALVGTADEAADADGLDDQSVASVGGESPDTTDCGPHVASVAEPGRGVEDAGQFVVGEVVSGTVRVGDVDHWRLTVRAGRRYRVVLDTRRTDEEATRTGLIYRSSVDGGATWGRNIVTDDTDDRVRETRILSVFGTAAAGELLLAVESQFGTESYQLAVLDPDTSVPSPYIVDCPFVERLTAGTGEAFELGEAGSDTEERWFAFEIPPEGEYRLSLSASATDPRAGAAIDYELRLLGRFGQLLSNRRTNVVRFATDSSVFHSDAVPLERNGAPDGGGSQGFARFRNHGPPLQVEAGLLLSP